MLNNNRLFIIALDGLAHFLGGMPFGIIFGGIALITFDSFIACLITIAVVSIVAGVYVGRSCDRERERASARREERQRKEREREKEEIARRRKDITS